MFNLQNYTLLKFVPLAEIISHVNYKRCGQEMLKLFTFCSFKML